MIKNVSEPVEVVGKIGRGTAPPETETSAKTGEKPDPEKVLIDLKQREAVLRKLIDEGGTTKEISRFHETLSATINELEKILADPETDMLSEERPT